MSRSALAVMVKHRRELSNADDDLQACAQHLVALFNETCSSQRACASSVFDDQVIASLASSSGPCQIASQQDNGLSAFELAAVIVIPLLVATVIALGLILCFTRNGRTPQLGLKGNSTHPRSHSDAFRGKEDALSAITELDKIFGTHETQGPLTPGGAPNQMVLVLTDVQNSTTLWEMLPTNIMDETMRLHDKTMRDHLSAYNGFESATEGDAFILSFQCSDMALNYCMKVQQSLLEQPWPAQVLSNPDGRSIFVLDKNGPSRRSKELSPTSSLRLVSVPLPLPLFPIVPTSFKSVMGLGLNKHKGPCKALTYSQASNYEVRAISRAWSEVNHSVDARDLDSPTLPCHHCHHSSQSNALISLSTDSKADGPVCEGIEDFLWLKKTAEKPVASLDASKVLLAFTEEHDFDDQEDKIDTSTPPEKSMTWMQFMGVEFPKVRPTAQRDPDKYSVIFRGPRVRMGMHCDICGPNDATYDSTLDQVTYSGPIMDMARAVCDACPGGMILMSAETFSKTTRGLAAKMSSTAPKALTVYAGDFSLKKHPDCHPDSSCPLFMSAAEGLAPRFAHIPPIRYAKPMALGTSQAPMGMVSIAFMHAIGASQLLHDMPEAGREGLALYHKVVCTELFNHNGYLVELVDGLILASFAQPEDAISWGLACQEALSQQEWSYELLSHPSCQGARQASSAGISPGAQFPSKGTLRLANASDAQLPSESTLRLANISSATLPSEVTLGLANASGAQLPSESTLRLANISSATLPSEATLGLANASGAPSPSDATLRLANASGSPWPSDATLRLANASGSPWPSEATLGLANASGATLLSQGTLRLANASVSPLESEATLGLGIADGHASHQKSKTFLGFGTSTPPGISVKVGIDTGKVAANVVATSGRLHYRGKVMNRASRVSSKAPAGHVLCSSVAWSFAQANTSFPKLGLRAEALGEFEMKGVAGPILVMDCFRDHSSTASHPPSPFACVMDDTPSDVGSASRSASIGLDSSSTVGPESYLRTTKTSVASIKTSVVERESEYSKCGVQEVAVASGSRGIAVGSGSRGSQQIEIQPASSDQASLRTENLAFGRVCDKMWEKGKEPMDAWEAMLKRRQATPTSKLPQLLKIARGEDPASASALAVWSSFDV